MITNPVSQAKCSFDGRWVDVDLKMCERLLRIYGIMIESKVQISSSVPMILGWMLIAIAQNIWMLIAGRTLCG